MSFKIWWICNIFFQGTLLPWRIWNCYKLLVVRHGCDWIVWFLYQVLLYQLIYVISYFTCYDFRCFGPVFFILFLLQLLMGGRFHIIPRTINFDKVASMTAREANIARCKYMCSTMVKSFSCFRHSAYLYSQLYCLAWWTLNV